ncbi:putative ribonuclease H-like domain-containing protein [Tanacetum coccineum]
MRSSPHPLIYNRPKKLDLSYSCLDEFKDPEFKSYGSKDSKQESSIVCDKKSDDSNENSDESLVKEQVLEDTSSFVESLLNVDKETVFLVDKKDRAKAVNTARPKAVNTARPHSAVVNAVRFNQANAVKASTCWVWRPTKLDSASITLKKHNYIDARGRSNGCSRHMTGNIAYLLDFKEFNRGYVTFRGGTHGGRISGKGTLKTDSLDFEDVYFVNELKFNLFSVSQMCDKKNYVLFTDTECLVLSPNFKLPDESQILLKIPRKDNMYSFDMKNIVPKESLTCLVAKATSDESMLWHMRLGHINFKNINKLVKDNLVRGFPTKRFENDQTCVACLKGKQHRASCKSKVLNPITKPLFMLHMDLFGPTFVSSLMHKKYCLVVTDDYSRFTWVFFLTTKDETSEILKNFIKEIENLVDKKVKIIRSDNGTEFKNKVMDDFCREKGTSEVNSQNCIMMPIWKDTSYFDSPTKDVDNGEPKTTNDAQKQVEDSPNNENAEQERFVDDSSTKDDPDHPDKVYKVVKALYGLHQAPKRIMLKFEGISNYSDVKLCFNPVDLEKLWSWMECDDVVYIYYRIYDWVFDRQRIFRYLKGKPTLGLWYSRDSPFELVAYTDSDYAGATQDRKSTTGGCQFLGNRLISWQCKKQIVVATSTTEAEYVAAASCCGQVLWIQNQLLDYGYNFMNTVININNNSNRRLEYLMLNASPFEVMFKKEDNGLVIIMSSPKFAETHNVVAFLEKTEESNGFAEIIDFLKASSVSLFFNSQSVSTHLVLETILGNCKVPDSYGVQQIQALVDRRGLLLQSQALESLS